MNHLHHLMKLTVIFSIIFTVTTTSVAQRPKVKWNAPPEDWQWVVPVKIRGMLHETIHSKSMNRKVGYNIYLPPSYQSAKQKRYSVVYYLHGASGSELSANTFSIGPKLVKAGKIGEVIYVFPNGGHFSKYRNWENANVKAETLLIEELIPAIDAKYRTIATREGRALAGWSMGGDASLRFAFKYPEMFCAAATFSAAIDWGATASGKDTIFYHSKRNIEKIRGKTGIMMVVGENDRLYQSHKKLLPHLDQLKIDYNFKSYPGVGHNLGKMMPKYGEAIAKMLAQHYAPAK